MQPDDTGKFAAAGSALHAQDASVKPLTEWQFAAAMEHSAIGTAIVSLKGQWLYTNLALRRLVGYEAAELAKLTFQDLTHPDDLANDLAHVERLLSGAATSYQMEKRYIRKGGGEVWVLLSVSLVRDAQGEPDCFISQIQDISERKAAEYERQRLTDRLMLATRAGGVGVWEWDLATDEVIWDERMLELYGVTDEDLAADPYSYSNAVHPDDRERVDAEQAHAKAASLPFDSEFRVVHKDGRVAHIRAIAKVVLEGDLAVRMIGISWDVTEARRLTVKAQAASEQKSQFLASMSHEIRTPLNGVLGMAQAMALDPLPEEQRARLNIIRDSGEVLLAILNDILDLAKVEAGELTIEAVNFDLGALLEAAKETFISIAEAKDVTLALDLGNAAGIYSGDPARVRQVVSNLVSNALKFTESGEIRMAARNDAAGLAIQVSDSGVGIPAAALEAIFDKFIQADLSVARTHGGTGLGLAISRELARRMGGDIEVKSDLGVGSTFTLRLPLSPVNNEAAAVVAVKPDDSARAGFKVLVAEDNAINQLVIKALLTHLDVVLGVVANGEEAVEAWRCEPWEVILMDVQMPVLDGVSATKRIRAEEASMGRARTPIIALTANAMQHQIEEYYGAGMDAFVSKPIDIRTLAAELERVLQINASTSSAATG